MEETILIESIKSEEKQKEKHKGRTKNTISRKNLIEIYLKGKEQDLNDKQIADTISMNYNTFYTRVHAPNFLSVLQAQQSIDKKDFSSIFSNYFDKFQASANNYLLLSNDIIKANLESGDKEKALKILYALEEKQKKIIELLIRIKESHQSEREKEHVIYFGCAECPKLREEKKETAQAVSIIVPETA